KRDWVQTCALPISTRVAGGLGGELLPYLGGQFVVRVPVEPAAHAEPLGRGVPIPAVLVGQHHFHDVVPEVLELPDQIREFQEVGDGGSVAEIGRAHV